jgi:O-antigen/teichoic acid export membrane protein
MTSARDAAAQTTGATVVRGGAWTAMSHVIPQLYALAVSIAAARVLGPSDFGRQSFISFIAISVLMTLTSGMALALMRSVAEAVGAGRPRDAVALTAWAWRVQAITALAGGGALVAAALFGARPGAAWILAGVFVALGVFQSVANAVLLGLQRFRSAATIGLVTGAAMVPVAIGVLAAGGGIVGLFAVEAAMAAVNLAWIAVLARRALGSPRDAAPVGPEVRAATLRFAGWTTANALVSLVVWRRSEFVFLAHYSTDVQIGLYSIAFATVTAIAALPERLSEVLVSAFATLRGADAGERIRTGFSRSLRLLLMATLPLTAGLAAVGPDLLRLVYGDEYREAGTVLLVVVGVIPFLAVSSVSASLMSGLGDARTPLTAGVFAAAVNIGLAFALVPRLEAVGAGLSNTGAQVAASAAMYAGARRLSGRVDWRPGSLARCALAALGCALTSVLALRTVGGAAGLVLAVPAGAVAFAALALALRVLSADDAAWLHGHFGHLLGGRTGAFLRRAGRTGAPS